MVDNGDDQYTNISLVEQWIQTDDGLRVNVTEFGQALAEFAKENIHTKNPHFPIIITKDLCRINQCKFLWNYTHLRTPKVFVRMGGAIGMLDIPSDLSRSKVFNNI